MKRVWKRRLDRALRGEKLRCTKDSCLWLADPILLICSWVGEFLKFPNWVQNTLFAKDSNSFASPPLLPTHPPCQWYCWLFIDQPLQSHLDVIRDKTAPRFFLSHVLPIFLYRKPTADVQCAFYAVIQAGNYRQDKIPLNVLSTCEIIKLRQAYQRNLVKKKNQSNPECGVFCNHLWLIRLIIFPPSNVSDEIKNNWRYHRQLNPWTDPFRERLGKYNVQGSIHGGRVFLLPASPPKTSGPRLWWLSSDLRARLYPFQVA